MKSIILTLFLVLSILSAAAKAEVVGCPARSSDDYYFRPDTFGMKDDFIRQWYSEQLRAMNEPSMWCGTTAGTEYRFTWLRTFHHPVVVRVTNKGNVARVEAVELDGAGGYEPGKELRRVSRPMTMEDWLSIQNTMETWGLKAPPERNGKDGSEWIFEQRTAQGYGAVTIWSPVFGPARAIGELFLSKAGIAVPPRENY